MTPRHRLDDPVLHERAQLRAAVDEWRVAMLWRNGPLTDRDRFRLWDLFGALDVYLDALDPAHESVRPPE